MKIFESKRIEFYLFLKLFLFKDFNGTRSEWVEKLGGERNTQNTERVYLEKFIGQELLIRIGNKIILNSKRDIFKLDYKKWREWIEKIKEFPLIIKIYEEGSGNPIYLFKPDWFNGKKIDKILEEQNSGPNND